MHGPDVEPPGVNISTYESIEPTRRAASANTGFHFSVRRPGCIKPSGRFLEQLAPDQHAADFAGSCADLIELGVPQQASGRIFVDVAVPAEELDRVEGAFRSLFGRIEDGAGGVFPNDSGFPSATRTCSATRSSPVTISVTGCSTCRRVFTSRK